MVRKETSVNKKLEFTPDQKKAINHIKNHLRIIACPGSGKTEVVARRVVNLIKHGSKPKNIVAITFTEKAAEELKARIRKVLDEDGIEYVDMGDMYAGTIHAFCRRMLQELDPKYKSYEVIDGPQRVAFIAMYGHYKKMGLDKLAERPGHDIPYGKYTVIDRFIYSADILMLEGINVNRLTNINFKNAYLKYLELLDNKRYLDFTSIIYRLIELLSSDKDKLREFNQKVKHLIIDEYQDVDPLQEKILELSSIGAESICVVGDDDQCIYQWKGTRNENILNFKKRYGKKYNVTDITINVNFRSTSGIVALASSLIKNNYNRLDKKNVTHNIKLLRKYDPGDIIHEHFENEQDEYNAILEKIHELSGTDFLDKNNNPYSLSLGDFAVLVRTNDDAARITHFLEHNNIDCVAYSGSSIFDRPEVNLARDCMKYLFQCTGYDRNSNIPEMEALKAAYQRVFSQDRFPPARVDRFEKDIQRLKKDIDQIKSKSPKDYFGGKGLQEIYHRILQAMGSDRFNFGEVYHYNLACLSTAISDYESVYVRLRAKEVEGFLHFLRAFGEMHYAEMQHNDPSLINAVKILTIHKAKGLEFPVVFIPGMVQKRSKSPTQSFVDETLYDIDRYTGTEEDERRLFYTAITRSEKYLFISGSKNRPTAKKNYKPHMFISELDVAYISHNKPLKKRRSGYPPITNNKAVFATTFSELTTYERCPQDYLYRHVYQYNAGVPVVFGYGTNIHNILDTIHNEYIKDGRIPGDSEIDSLFNRMFKMRYATDNISENMEKAAKKVVKNYVNLFKDEFKYILETEKTFELVINEALITGRIDLLKKVDEQGKVIGVEIIDFKNEDDATNIDEKTYKLNHDEQLRLYALGCKPIGLDPKRAYIHNLEPGNKTPRRSVNISPEKLEETKQKITYEVKNIIKKKYVPNPDLKKCSGCDFDCICYCKIIK